MKANEAPEKLYVELCSDGVYAHTREWGNSDNIEYTRTDAFINKALKWYCRDCECNDNCDANHKCAFRDFFEMYLKGNENALPPKFKNALDPEGFTTENYRCRHLISKLQNDFIEKACEWLEKNIVESTGIDSYTITESFKQAMKE